MSHSSNFRALRTNVPLSYHIRKSRGRRTGITTLAALALIVISFVLGVGATVIVYNIAAVTHSASTTTTTQAGPPAASINQKPTVLPIKIDWCNTDNSGEDRFCPSTITVVQGDIVQILFIQNDTDAHTFTLTSGPYDFQINNTVAGSADFLQSGSTFNSSCINGNYAQESSGISTSYCVSGSSLLSPSSLSALGASDYASEQNANPHSDLGNASNPHPITIPVSDEVYFGGSANLSGVSIPSNASSSEVWGIAAFQASYAGVFEFTCIYHVANGMFGYLIVLPNAYCDGDGASSCGLNSTS